MKEKKLSPDISFKDYIIDCLFCLIWDLTLLFVPMAILRFIFDVENLGVLLVVGGVFVLILGKYIITKEEGELKDE